ncbi:MAG: hypothetical protein U0804_12975 [Gemmataceae bacterium]
MPARIALLALLAVVGAALARLPVAAPRPPAERVGRLATAAEIDALDRAVRAAGGRVDYHYRGRVPSYIPNYPVVELDRVTAVEQIDRLPDPEFDYALQITISPATPPGVLARLARLRHLYQLQLRLEDRLPDGSAGALDVPALVAELAALPHLEQLGFHSWGSADGDAVVAALSQLRSLKRVGILYGMTEAGFEALSRQHNLEFVAVGGSTVTDAGLAHLARMPRLRGLNVQEARGVTAAGLRPFTRDPRLTTLIVRLGPPGDAVIAEVAKLHTLEYLQLDTQPRGEPKPDLRPLVALRNLKTLLCDTRVGDAEFDVMASLPRLETLVALIGVDGSDAGIRRLRQLSALRFLYLYVGHRPDAAAAELAALPRLESLILVAGPGLTDAGLDALAAAPRLSELAIAPTDRPAKVTEVGLRRFIERMGPRLWSLDVSGVRVGDEVVAELAADAPNLRLLSLGDAGGVTAQSVPPLLTLPLRGLRLSGSSIGAAGAERLKGAIWRADVQVPFVPSPSPVPKK